MIIAVIILVAAIIVLCVAVLKLRQRANKTIQYNTEIERQNKALEDTNSSLRSEYNTLSQQKEEELRQLDSVHERISIQNNILKSLSSSAENMRKGAEEQAKTIFEAKVAALNKDYEEQKKQIDDRVARESLLLLQKIEVEKGKLKDLEDKQLAFIQAQQRAEEMEAQKDYYRLVVGDLDLSEIKILRNLQVQFSRKEAIDKLIWESYYKAPYDLLMSHLFDGSAKVCGIYKITNLENGQAYIGQSVDIRERFRQHIKSALTSGPATNKLYQQMKKYGPENFTFEVLETVDRGKLNEREVYWIDFYKTKEFGMNGTKGGS